MATFNLQKGRKFQINKGVATVMVAMGWDVAEKAGENFDLDASAFGLVITPQGSPKFFGDGSHAVCYANTELTKNPDGSLQTADGTMTHTGDNRTGAGEGDDEVIRIALSRLPQALVEVSLFVTIYEARKRKQDFGRVNNAYVRVLDADSGEELCRYDLSREFAGNRAIQVGSLVRENGTWAFKAVGVGSEAELGDVLTQYS